LEKSIHSKTIEFEDCYSHFGSGNSAIHWSTFRTVINAGFSPRSQATSAYPDE
jgi:hypothetical protein